MTIDKKEYQVISSYKFILCMVPNYQIDGKTGTWLPYDSEVVEGVCFFMMRNEQRKDKPQTAPKMIRGCVCGLCWCAPSGKAE